MGIKESISELRQKFDADLSEVRDSESIEKLRVSYLGKKGSVTELLKGLKDLSGAEKKEFGQTINTLKREVDERITAHVERIRQEVAFRRSDLQQLYAELCREGILESGARCLQEAPPPEGLTREEQQCFRTCMSGLGRAEAQQECEQLDYYRARLQALQQTAEHAARRQAGLPRKLGLAAGMAMALLLI